jgi:hypothetical protein
MRTPHIPASKAATDGLVCAFMNHWFKDQDAPPELWHPYHQLLVDRCLAAAAKHADVVVSMSIYRREVRDFLRERSAGCPTTPTPVSLLYDSSL